jgi:hypothetical protein
MANGLLMFIMLDADATASLSLVISIIGLAVSVISAVAAIAAAVYSRRALGRNESAPVERKIKQPKRAGNRLYDIDSSTPSREEHEATKAPAPAKPPLPIQIETELPPPAETPIQTQTPAPAEIPTPTPGQISTPAPTRIPTEVPAPAPAQAPVLSQPQIPHIPISVEGEAMGEVPLELLVTVQDASVRVTRVERLNQARKLLGASACKATDKPLVFKSILATEKVTQWWSAGESTSDGEDEAKKILRVYLLLDQTKKEVFRDVPVSIGESLRTVGITSLHFWTIKGSI